METLNIAYDALLNQLGNFGEIETHWDEYKSLAGIGWIEGAKWMRNKIGGNNG